MDPRQRPFWPVRRSPGASTETACSALRVHERTSRSGSRSTPTSLERRDDWSAEDLGSDKFVYASIDGMLRNARSAHVLPRAEGVRGHAGAPEGHVLRPRDPRHEAERPGHRHHPARGDAGLAARHPRRRRHRRGGRRSRPTTSRSTKSSSGSRARRGRRSTSRSSASE